MHRQQEPEHFQKWLLYSPLLYNHLLICPATNLSLINSIKWLRGVTNTKMSFKYMQGFICVAGSMIRSDRVGSFDGGFSIYKAGVVEDLDDQRLEPVVKLRSHWKFPEEIGSIQQYGNGLEDVDRNNMFAITYKNHPQVLLMSTRKLLQQGVHTSYAQGLCTKLQGHKQPITSTKWAKMGESHKLFTSSNDNKIIQWDIQKIVMERQLIYHRQAVKAIVPLYDYSYFWGEGPVVSEGMMCIASVGLDGYVFLWDARSAVPVQKINPKQKELYALDCVSKNCLITGGEDGSIKMWDLRYLKQYLYEAKNNKAEGHTKAVKYLKVNRAGTPQQLKGKNEIGRVKFTSSGPDNKVIEWQQKLQFVHQGHQSQPVFDLSDQYNLCLSADTKKNVMMIWQSGVSLSQNQA